MKKILAQLESTKYFYKIDICQVFYQIWMFKDTKRSTTFLTRFEAFKYLVILFGFYNKPVFGSILVKIHYLTFYIDLYKHI